MACTRASVCRWFLLGLSLCSLVAFACCSSETATHDPESHIPADAGGDSVAADAGSDRDVPSTDSDGAAAQDADGSAPPDATTSELAAVVSDVVSPHVDPLHPDDLAKSIGMVVAVVVQGQPSTFGFGATEANGSAVPDGDSVFQVGSVTKVLTGLMLARLVVDDSGMDHSSGINPLLPVILGEAPALQQVTLGQLVSHHAGLPKFATNLTDRDGDGVRDPGIDPLSPAEGYSLTNLRDFLASYAPSPPPGSQYVYSNIGFGLLGVALVNYYGSANYHSLLHEQLASALTIDDLWGQADALDADDLARVVQGYANNQQGTGRIVGRTASMGVTAGAGEALATGNSMAQVLATLTGQVPGQLDDAIALALQPVGPMPTGDEIGYGIVIETGAGGTLYKKLGMVSSYSAFIAFRREPALGVALMTNVGNFEKLGAIGLELLDQLGQKVARQPD